MLGFGVVALLLDTSVGKAALVVVVLKMEWVYMLLRDADRDAEAVQ